MTSHVTSDITLTWTLPSRDVERSAPWASSYDAASRDPKQRPTAGGSKGRERKVDSATAAVLRTQERVKDLKCKTACEAIRRQFVLFIMSTDAYGNWRTGMGVLHLRSSAGV